MKKRCDWADGHPLLAEYHDSEWGVPVHDNRKLFEFLVLDAFQAGLSWLTILKKRENFRRAFDDFDPARIARYRQARKGKLMQDAGIVRNRLKIEATIQNAKAFLELEKEEGLSTFLWQFVDGKPIVNRFREMSDLPARTDVSDRMSRALKDRGFRFVGSTICYAFMQAAGMVNDHLVSCFRFRELSRGSRR